jgi:rRNA-processing protein FCF1
MVSRRSGKTKTDSVTAFPDTNIFLHFQPFDQLPWREELKATTVRLHVAAVVVRELNKHREKHPAEHIRERARKILKKIRECFLNGTGEVADGVVLCCDAELEGFDMAARQLDPSSQDDCILAAILDYQERHPHERVLLVTDDAPFAVRAHTKGVASVEVSERLRIPPQADAKVQEIRELKEKLRDVERRLPRLSLSFPDGNAHSEVAIFPDVIVTEADAQNYVRSQVAPQHPSDNVERWNSIATNYKLAKSRELSESVAPLMDMMSSIAQMVAMKASTDRDIYFDRCASFFVEWWKHTNEMRRTKELKLILTNTGTTPAEEIYIFLRVPKSVGIFPAGGLPPAPSPPPPPGQKRALAIDPKSAAQVVQAHPIRYVRPVEFPDCWELQYNLPRLNHHVTELLTGLHVRFPPHPAPRPFRIEYKIAAVNMPDPVKGALDIIPKGDRGSLKRIAGKAE